MNCRKCTVEKDSSAIESFDKASRINEAVKRKPRAEKESDSNIDSPYLNSSLSTSGYLRRGIGRDNEKGIEPSE